MLLPGLVNAHAHLDLAFSPSLPARGDFADWLIAVGGARQASADPWTAAAIQAGHLARQGVTAVGDIDAHLGAGVPVRRAAGLSGLSFLEVVGVAAPSCRARLAAALAAVDAGGGRGLLGLSPHAPYSVHERVLPEVARAARARGLRLAMHLAESEEETRYLLHGDGPLTRLLDAIGRGRPFERPPGLRPLAYARAAGVLEGGALVVHGNDLDDDDIGQLVATGSSVVYCHGTHSHFGRPRHRLLDLERAGVTLALGTDSSASNAEIDLRREIGRLLEARPDVAPGLALKAATHGGRAALGLPTGSARFARGSPADGMLLAEAPDDIGQATADEVVTWAFSVDARVASTIHAGRVLAPADGPHPRVDAPCLDSSGGGD